MADQYHIRVLPVPERQILASEIARIEDDPQAISRVAAKAWQITLRLEQVPAHAALILKQLLLALDGDALIQPAVYLGISSEPTPVLAWASERAWPNLCATLQALPVPALSQLGRDLQAALAVDSAERGSLTVNGHVWRWGERTLVMGIINATPDSFSQDGLLGSDLSASVAAQAAAFAAAGADMLDIGGESTRPGAATVADDEEIRRVLPAIAAARQSCNLPISIDTYKAPVAAAALEAGAHLVNDIWGLRSPDGGWNIELAALVARRNVPIVLMHNRRAPNTSTAYGQHFTNTHYNDLLGEIIADLWASLSFAASQGIRQQQIIIDPGIGFGKTPDHNIQLLRRLREIQSLGFPILIGTSRKSFIGLALKAGPQQRTEGTGATVAHAIHHGADIVRVHDVAAIVPVCRMTDAIVRPGAWERLTT